MFGPKVGDFRRNATGIDQDAVTVDLWLARTYNRMSVELPMYPTRNVEKKRL